MNEFTTAAGTLKKAPGFPKDVILKEIADNNMPADLGTAIFIATKAFAFKKTWSGSPYILHCLFVGDIHNDDLGNDEKIVGVLHDLIEDTDWTYEDLEKIGYTPFHTEAIRGLTKLPGELYFDGSQRCSHNPISRRRKRRDNKDNLDLTRGYQNPTPKQKWAYRVSRDYLQAVQDGFIPSGYSVWKFLMRPDQAVLAKEMLDPCDKGYDYIASQTSEPVPDAIKRIYGEPKPFVKPRKRQEVLTPA